MPGFCSDSQSLSAWLDTDSPAKLMRHTSGYACGLDFRVDSLNTHPECGWQKAGDIIRIFLKASPIQAFFSARLPRRPHLLHVPATIFCPSAGTKRMQTKPVQTINQNKSLLFACSQIWSQQWGNKIIQVPWAFITSCRDPWLLLQVLVYALLCAWMSVCLTSWPCLSWCCVNISFLWKSSLTPQCGLGNTSDCSHVTSFLL